MVSDQSFDTPTTPGRRPRRRSARDCPDALTWLNGEDGVSVLPGAPVLPKQVENVTGTQPWGGGSSTLSGVGFRGGTYEDVDGTAAADRGARHRGQHGAHHVQLRRLLARSD